MQKKVCNIHIGSLIKAQIEEQNIKVQDFAKAIGYSRTTVYHIFKRKSIDTELLLKISSVLHYDFIGKCYDCDPSCLFHNQIDYTVSINTNQDLERLKLFSKKLLRLKAECQ